MTLYYVLLLVSVSAVTVHVLGEGVLACDEKPDCCEISAEGSEEDGIVEERIYHGEYYGE